MPCVTHTYTLQHGSNTHTDTHTHTCAYVHMYTKTCVTFATAMCGGCLSSDVVMSLSLVSVGDTREGALLGDTIDLHAYMYIHTYIRTPRLTQTATYTTSSQQLAVLRVLCMKKYHATCSLHNVLTLVGVKAGHRGARRRGRFALCCVCAQPDGRGAIVSTLLHPQAHATTVHVTHAPSAPLNIVLYTFAHHHTLTHYITPSHTASHTTSHPHTLHHTPPHTLTCCITPQHYHTCTHPHTIHTISCPHTLTHHIAPSHLHTPSSELSPLLLLESPAVDACGVTPKHAASHSPSPPFLPFGGESVKE